MSLSLALGNALTGLTATARMAEVVSSNLANALTEGYARRSVALSAGTVDGRGAGVQVAGITRHLDRGLMAERRDAGAGLAGREATLAGLKAIETAVGSEALGTSVSARLLALEEALVSAGAEPSSEARLSTVLDRLGGVAESLGMATAAVQRERERADAAIARDVATLNDALQGIQALNGDIVAAQATGQDATALMDQRQALIDRVSAIVPVREMDRQGGALALITPQGATLIDGRAVVVGFVPSPTIVPETTLAGGGLAGLTVNGLAASPAGVGRLNGGSLGASFALRDVEAPRAQAALDAVARDLVERFADPATDPTLGVGDAGLLTDGGAAFDPADEAGLAGRLAVNAGVDPARGGALWRLRDGVGATVGGPAGDAAQIEAWVAALDEPRALSTGGRLGSAAALAADAESSAASRRLSAEESQAHASARFGALDEAEAAGGVDSDYEMQMLLQIEQAYAANARVIATVEAMMQSLMEI